MVKGSTMVADRDVRDRGPRICCRTWLLDKKTAKVVLPLAVFDLRKLC